MGIEEALGKLGNADANVRYGALAAIGEAAERGEDIAPAEGAVVKALEDRDADVRQKAARLLTSIYGKAGQWDRLNALLMHPRGDVRASALGAADVFIGKFDMQKDLPALLKAADDSDFEMRSEAARFFEKASAAGQDISFAIPGLKKMAIYGDDRMKERAANALKNAELRKGGTGGAGGAGGSAGLCQKCLGCSTGIGPGEAAGCFIDEALIIKSISCCAGDVTHRVFRCTACGRRYLSTYFDHSDSGHGQLSIYVISDGDAARITAEFGKCPSQQWKGCKCQAHMEYLKDERVPVQGSLAYNFEDKD